MATRERYPLANMVNRYARGVAGGKVLSCKWVRLACEAPCRPGPVALLGLPVPLGPGLGGADLQFCGEPEARQGPAGQHEDPAGALAGVHVWEHLRVEAQGNRAEKVSQYEGVAKLSHAPEIVEMVLPPVVMRL